MNYLVVGGAGYIGSCVVNMLVQDKNNKVWVLDNLSTGFPKYISKRASLIVGDITSKDDVIKAFKRDYDCVFDFAAKIVVPESVSDPLGYYQANSFGVINLLEQMQLHHTPHFIFSSSAAVYGEKEDGICDEDDVCKPINPYGETKLTSEKIISWSSSAYGFTYICFRYFNVAGADDIRGVNSSKLSHLIPIAVEAGLGLRKELVIAGNDYPTEDGTCIRDYVHVLDVARAHILGANYLIDKGESTILNIGSNSGYSVLEVANEVNKVIPVPYNFGSRRPGDPFKLVANASKIKEVLGFTPELGLKEMAESDLKFRKAIKKPFPLESFKLKENSIEFISSKDNESFWKVITKNKEVKVTVRFYPKEIYYWSFDIDLANNPLKDLKRKYYLTIKEVFTEIVKIIEKE